MSETSKEILRTLGQCYDYWSRRIDCNVKYARPDLFSDLIEKLEPEEIEWVKRLAKEMYETAMLTGGGSPEAWANHVRARNAFASALAELKGQDDE